MIKSIKEFIVKWASATIFNERMKLQEDRFESERRDFKSQLKDRDSTIEKLQAERDQANITITSMKKENDFLKNQIQSPNDDHFEPPIPGAWAG